MSGPYRGGERRTLPATGLGPRLYPEMEAMFSTNPDRVLTAIYSAQELKEAWNSIDESFWRILSVVTRGMAGEAYGRF